MCRRCWTEEGSPDEWTPRTARLLDLIAELYKIHPTGGPLHVQLDDYNLTPLIRPVYDGWSAEDLDALYCDGWALADLDPLAPVVVDGDGVSTRQLCDDIADILNDMTTPQRYAALAYRDGFLPRPAAPPA